MYSSLAMPRVSSPIYASRPNRFQQSRSRWFHAVRCLIWLSIPAFLVCLTALLSADAQEPLRIPQADAGFKVDILLVVAHPDDEGAATPYLARAIDDGKRVAVVYGTRGSSGENQAGAELAAALGDIREIEARRA